MLRRSPVPWLALLGLFLGPPGAAATDGAPPDSVQLQNGDRLSGRLRTLAAGSMVLATDYAGEVTIALEAVATLATAAPVTVQLARRWAVELDAVLELDTEPPPGVEERDLLWIVGLQYGRR